MPGSKNKTKVEPKPNLKTRAKPRYRLTLELNAEERADLEKLRDRRSGGIGERAKLAGTIRQLIKEACNGVRAKP